MDEHDVERAILLDTIDRELARLRIVNEGLNGICYAMMVFYGGMLGCLVVIGTIATIAEQIGQHGCRKMLREAGVTEPAEWPNCRNIEGQEILREHYGDSP